MAGAASQAEDTNSSRAPGLTSGLQGSVNVHRGALLLLPQWQCISSFVFYMILNLGSYCEYEFFSSHNRIHGHLDFVCLLVVCLSMA